MKNEPLVRQKHIKKKKKSPLFGPLAPRLPASVVAHWGGNWTVPWPLVLRLLASAEHCSTGPASPAA
jgi:hypothetical protein